MTTKEREKGYCKNPVPYVGDWVGPHQPIEALTPPGAQYRDCDRPGTSTGNVDERGDRKEARLHKADKVSREKTATA